MFALCGEFERQDIVIPLRFHAFGILFDLSCVLGEHLLDTHYPVCPRTLEWNFELHILMYLIF